ncbi:MAG: oligosaccharide flippase family protein [Bacteroidaceae bacterium]|nr:oligosaccharide flippase family protein [Bacteroidaceae bacterium]
MSTQYRSILKYVGLFGSIQGLNLMVGLLRGKLVALILGPSGMGLSSMLNTAVSLLSSSTNLGIGISGVKELSLALPESTEGASQEAAARKIAIIRVWSLIAAVLGLSCTCLVAPLIDMLSFSWGNHTLHYMLLAPTVALMAVTGGETAILKAARELKHLAMIQIFTVVMSLFIAVPIYYFFGESGIVPVLFLTALATMLATVFYSYRLFPLQLKNIRQHISDGGPMVKLGLSFVAAGMVGSSVEMYIRAFLNVQADLETVGLYYAAFLIAITYPSSLLGSLENEYFSRLSAVCADSREMCRMVNAQVEVLLMVMFPIIAVLIIALPIALPMLFSTKFNGAIPLAQVTLLAMFLRSATMPIEYSLLARGESRRFFYMEALWGALTVGFLTIGYHLFGLIGMGYGWVAEYLSELIIILIAFRLLWGFRLSGKATALLLCEGAVLVAICIAIVQPSPI